MRARHRHFNAKDIGATFIFDSRFIRGLSDGNAVSTWDNRVGANNATQATAGNQPVYKTNAFNGNPVVEFTVTKFMTFAKQDATQCWMLCLIKRTSTAEFQNVFGVWKTDNSNPTFGLSVHNNANYGPVIFGSTNNLWPRGSSIRNDQWRSLYLVWLGGSTSGSTNYLAWDDGNSFTLTDSSVVGTQSRTSSIIGDGGATNSIGGQIALIIFAPTQSSNSLRKKISYSASFSFKLSSS